MSWTLFEVLSGEYVDETPINSAPQEMANGLSIVSHLTRLLNSRQGTLKHLPDYGLPDIADIYQGLPFSLEKLIRHIKFVIEKYEPRLKNIEIYPLTIKDLDAILRLEIRGTVSNGNEMRFATYFLSGGEAKVKPHQQIV